MPYTDYMGGEPPVGRDFPTENVYLAQGQGLMDIEMRHPGALAVAKTYSGHYILLPRKYTFWEKVVWFLINEEPRYARMAIYIPKDGNMDRLEYKPIGVIGWGKIDYILSDDGEVLHYHHNDHNAHF